MAGPPTPLGLEDRGRHPKGGGLGAWVKTHRNQSIGIAGGLGVAGYLWYRNRSSSGSSTGTGTGSSGTTSATDPTGTYDSSSIDQYNALASAISQLNSEDTGFLADITKIDKTNAAQSKTLKREHNTNVRQGKIIDRLKKELAAKKAKKPAHAKPKTVRPKPPLSHKPRPLPVGPRRNAGPRKAAVTPKTKAAPHPAR